jgi:1-acyl-sn-glycerol-3-phosphate acyltransferase
MAAFKRKKRALIDRKNALVYFFWMLVNRISIAVRFKDLQIIGKHNLPKSGPFLLLSNHISRWDGLIVYQTINRPANFMVSPNELMGLQGTVLSSMGSFPADPRADLINHALSLLKKGEGIVVFPEGNIFRDGSTHNFKNGAAKIAQAAAENGIDLPVIPAAIHYADDGRVAQIALGTAVKASEYFGKPDNAINGVLRTFCERMHREVCHLRGSLGSIGDRLALFTGARKFHWPEMLRISAQEVVIAESCSSDNQHELSEATCKKTVLSIPLNDDRRAS